jgi:hypothetical protein
LVGIEPMELVELLVDDLRGGELDNEPLAVPRKDW